MEKQNLWTVMGRLNQYVYIAERLDARLSAQVAELQMTDPDKAKALSQDVLFYVRQKHQDLLTQLAVSIQSYLAIDIIIKNNIELIKGVDRASTTTISALRTAVIVAQALGNQKLVLDQITALNTTTSQMIQRTSEMLKENSARIQEQAASSTIGLEQLQAAFANIYQTMDSIDEFKARALDTMAQTIGVLEGEVVKSKDYLERVAQQDTRNSRCRRSPSDRAAPTSRRRRTQRTHGFLGLADRPGRHAAAGTVPDVDPHPRRPTSRPRWRGRPTDRLRHVAVRGALAGRPGDGTGAQDAAPGSNHSAPG